MAAGVRYQLVNTGGIGLTLVSVVGIVAAVGLFGGLPQAITSRAGAAPPAAAQRSGVSRFSHEVDVTSAGRGCRWESSGDPEVQVANCGDDADAVRVVFNHGRVSEYRLTARLNTGGAAVPAPARMSTPSASAARAAPARAADRQLAN